MSGNKETGQNFFRSKTFKSLVFVFLDIILINISAFFTLLILSNMDLKDLRFGNFYLIYNYARIAIPFTVVTVVIYLILGLYRNLWQYYGIHNAIQIFLGGIIPNFLCACVLFIKPGYLPNSFPVINAAFMILLSICLRFSYRYYKSATTKGNGNKIKDCRRTMLVGAGDAGALILLDVNNSPKAENHIVCVIDDDKSKVGSNFYGVPILGNRYNIKEVADKQDIEEIIIAIPSAPSKDRKEILSICQSTGKSVRILPPVYKLASGEVNIEKAHKVEVEDLLGRDSVEVESKEIAAYVCSKTVLVTGGGGSIGSELCRQVAANGPKRLIIFDIYENNAYDIQHELKSKYPELELVTLIGSVRDEVRVRDVFEKYHPEIVYHAAAHKHVPLMEDSPLEAIKNNVFGTYNVASAAHEYGAETFIMISTDKAVNPTNVMGATKRVCEMVIQHFANISDTKFAAVRFGNVLGSNGSVVPLFRKQIEEGGPVTVTHPDIIRYFMTIPEAVSLVLQAGAYAKEGEVFVLDMGEPVKIDDLARNMIRLSGYEPDVDIKIKYTGLRDGEKLFEELLLGEEGLDKTPNDLIYIGHPPKSDDAVFLANLEILREAVDNDERDVHGLLKKIVPEFHPENAGKVIK